MIEILFWIIGSISIAKLFRFWQFNLSIDQQEVEDGNNLVVSKGIAPGWMIVRGPTPRVFHLLSGSWVRVGDSDVFGW